MIQFNQIGKKRKKEEILNAKIGKTYISPNNKEYCLNWDKIARTYFIIVEYKGYKMRVKEADFNLTPIDQLLNTIEKEIQ